MSQSQEVWQLIGATLQSRRWNISFESHVSVRLQLLSSAQQTISNEMKRICKTDSKISCSINKTYYLWQQELYRLLPLEFMFKINDKKLDQRCIQSSNAMHPSSKPSQLFMKFKKQLLLYNIDVTSEQIIQIFVNMMNLKHTHLDTQAAILKINMLKERSLTMSDKVHLFNDMVITFSWTNKFMVNIHFTTNTIILGSGFWC